MIQTPAKFCILLLSSYFALRSQAELCITRNMYVAVISDWLKLEWFVILYIFASKLILVYNAQMSSLINAENMLILSLDLKGKIWRGKIDVLYLKQGLKRTNIWVMYSEKRLD